MKQQKRQMKRRDIEVKSLGGQYIPTTVLSAQDTILHQLPLFEEEIITAKCGKCEREIWVSYYPDGIVYFCSTCSNELPR